MGWDIAWIRISLLYQPHRLERGLLYETEQVVMDVDRSNFTRCRECPLRQISHAILPAARSTSLVLPLPACDYVGHSIGDAPQRTNRPCIPVALGYRRHIAVSHSCRHSLFLCPFIAGFHDCSHFNDPAWERSGLIRLRCAYPA